MPEENKMNVILVSLNHYLQSISIPPPQILKDHIFTASM